MIRFLLFSGGVSALAYRPSVGSQDTPVTHARQVRASLLAKGSSDATDGDIQKLPRDLSLVCTADLLVAWQGAHAALKVQLHEFNEALALVRNLDHSIWNAVMEPVARRQKAVNVEEKRLRTELETRTDLAVARKNMANAAEKESKETEKESGANEVEEGSSESDDTWLRHS